MFMRSSTSLSKAVHQEGNTTTTKGQRNEKGRRVKFCSNTPGISAGAREQKIFQKVRKIGTER